MRALSLMEMARHAMLMYTSCGWFFDELSGIETVQCMQYAARVAELLERGRRPSGRARARRSAVGARARTSPTRATAAACGSSACARRGSIRRRSRRTSRCARSSTPDARCSRRACRASRSSSLDRVERRSRPRADGRGARARALGADRGARRRWCFAGLYLGEQHVTGGVRPPPSAAGVDARSSRSSSARSRPPTCSRRSARSIATSRARSSRSARCCPAAASA